MTTAPPPLGAFPIQLATSWMLGTVADTITNRTDVPRAFIRETTTSSVLPRVSFRMWTCISYGKRQHIARGRGGRERGSRTDLVDEEELDLGEDAVVFFPATQHANVNMRSSPLNTAVRTSYEKGYPTSPPSSHYIYPEAVKQSCYSSS